jgi:hypothetical protein
LVVWRLGGKAQMLTYRGKPIPPWFIWLTLALQVGLAMLLCWLD